MSQTKSQLNTLVKHHRKWLKDNSERIYQRELKYLEQDLALGSLQALQNVADSLARLATIFGIKGVVGILDGKAQGRESVGLSLSYHYWCLKLRVESFFETSHRQPNPTNYTSRMASILCYAIASETTAWEQYASKRLLAISTDAEALDEGCWSRRSFEPFTLALEDFKQKKIWPTEAKSNDLGAYAGLVRNWNGDRFGDSLVAVCDYHCRNMEDVGDESIAEFKYPPFDIMPIEILAIMKVRATVGLEIPEINHPLLNTPLGKLEQIPVPSEDDVLQQVQRAASSFFQ
jgi:hypothetical protein